MKINSYWDKEHWQCWLVPQIIVTRGSGCFALGFRWLFWGASIGWEHEAIR